MLTRVLDAPELEFGRLVWRAPARAAAPQRAGDDSVAVASDRQLKEAFEAGLMEGEARARKQLEQKVGQLAANTAEAIAAVATTRADALERAEADVVRLSIDIARRVLHREVSVDPQALGALVRAALEKLGGQERYRVRVHPGHAMAVRSCLDEIRPGAAVEIISDPAIPEGGMIFEVAQGALDASVETQLNEIERGLANELGGRD